MIDHFRCEICSELRHHDLIGVLTFDLSEKHNLPEGSFIRNINYCNDKQECFDKATEKGKKECSKSEDTHS